MKIWQQISEIINDERRQYITVPYRCFMALQLVIWILITLCLFLCHGIGIILSVFLVLPLLYFVVQYYRLWRIYYSRVTFFINMCITAAVALFVNQYITFLIW